MSASNVSSGYSASAQSNTHAASQPVYSQSQQQPSTFSYGFSTLPTSYPAHSQHDASTQQQYTYSSQTLPAQPQLAVHPHPSYSVPSTSEASKFSEVVIHEPDLSKQPQRSAMKGAKSKEMFQKHLAQTLRTSLTLPRQSDESAAGVQWQGGAGDAPPKVRPRVGPKPTIRIQDKENMRPQSESSDDEEINWRDDEESKCMRT